MKQPHSLIDTYKAASATDQAALLAAIIAPFESNKAPSLDGPASLLDPHSPRCPTCQCEISECEAVNVSIQTTSVEIDGATAIDAAASIGDYHVTHYVTLCCRAAIKFGHDFEVIFG